MASDEKILEVVGITTRVAMELSGLFGFDVDHSGNEMLALQAAILEIFGGKIRDGSLNDEFAMTLSVREAQMQAVADMKLMRKGARVRE